MQIGMVLGGFLAIRKVQNLRAGRRKELCPLLGQNLLCACLMLLGMTLGGLYLFRWQQAAGMNSLLGMLGGMSVGMAWGMVANVVLHRGLRLMRRSPS